MFQSAPPTSAPLQGFLRPSGSKRSAGTALRKPTFAIRPIPLRSPWPDSINDAGRGSTFRIRYVSRGPLCPPRLPQADFRFAPVAASFDRAGPITPGLRRMLPVQIAPAIPAYRLLHKPYLPAPPMATSDLHRMLSFGCPLRPASGLRRLPCAPARLACCF